jgi:phage terminase small subunit
LPLGIESALEAAGSKNEADAWLNLLLADPEIKELMLKKLREIMQTSQIPVTASAKAQVTTTPMTAPVS